MLGRLFGLMLAILGAGSLSQFPEFVQQYSQRLGGHVDELRAFVEDFDKDARAAGKTRTEALAAFQTNPDAFVSERGRSASETILRFEHYGALQTQLDQASPFQRLWIFATTYEEPIASAAWDDFEPAIPLTIEGAAHTGAGLIGGLSLGWLCVKGGRAARKGARKATRQRSDVQRS